MDVAHAVAVDDAIDEVADVVDLAALGAGIVAARGVLPADGDLVLCLVVAEGYVLGSLRDAESHPCGGTRAEALLAVGAERCGHLDDVLSIVLHVGSSDAEVDGGAGRGLVVADGLLHVVDVDVVVELSVGSEGLAAEVVDGCRERAAARGLHGSKLGLQVAGGSGCGVLTLLWCDEDAGALDVAVEVDEDGGLTGLEVDAAELGFLLDGVVDHPVERVVARVYLAALQPEESLVVDEVVDARVADELLLGRGSVNLVQVAVLADAVESSVVGDAHGHHVLLRRLSELGRGASVGVECGVAQREVAVAVDAPELSDDSRGAVGVVLRGAFQCHRRLVGDGRLDVGVLVERPVVHVEVHDAGGIGAVDHAALLEEDAAILAVPYVGAAVESEVVVVIEAGEEAGQLARRDVEGEESALLRLVDGVVDDVGDEIPVVVVGLEWCLSLLLDGTPHLVGRDVHRLVLEQQVVQSCVALLQRELRRCRVGAALAAVAAHLHQSLQGVFLAVRGGDGLRVVQRIRDGLRRASQLDLRLLGCRSLWDGRQKGEGQSPKRVCPVHLLNGLFYFF